MSGPLLRCHQCGFVHIASCSFIPHEGLLYSPSKPFSREERCEERSGSALNFYNCKKEEWRYFLEMIMPAISSLWILK